MDERKQDLKSNKPKILPTVVQTHQQRALGITAPHKYSVQNITSNPLRPAGEFLMLQWKYQGSPFSPFTSCQVSPRHEGQPPQPSPSMTGALSCLMQCGDERGTKRSVRATKITSRTRSLPPRKLRGVSHGNQAHHSSCNPPAPTVCFPGIFSHLIQHC